MRLNITVAMHAIWVSLVIMINTGFVTPVRGLSIEKSAYQELIIEIKDNVPVDECSTILADLEIALASTSQFLFTALDGRAYIGNAIVMLPPAWPNNCLPKNRTLATSRGERSDITITVPHQIYRDSVWTQQSGGCGEAGDQIYGSYIALRRDTIGRELVREWAKYRYGVFDEVGFAADPIYPKCYRTDKEHPTGCSDAAIKNNGLCDTFNGRAIRNTTTTTSTSATTTDSTARSSIMFAAEAPNVVMFCDEGTHNRYAPTKHNQMCNRRSTLDVILKNADFDPSNMVAISPSTIINTTPTIEYKKRQLTRYVLIIDETKDTMVRESWSFLRMAIRKWVVYDLPPNSEVGIILANDTSSAKIFDISALDMQKNRDYIASFIPFSTSESQRPGCINCAVKDAIAMLDERYKRDGPANSVILVVAPGMDFNTDFRGLGRLAKDSKVKVATINYPGVIRRQPLDLLAAESDGLSYTVYEKKQNGEKSYLTTYFELSNIFYNILVQHYEGNRLNLPMEIHRKELFDVSDDNTSAKRISRQITSAFMLDSAMGTPSSFFIYTHNAENPLIQSAKLTSPSGVTTSIRSDQRLPVKQLAISAIIGETGTWTYTIDRYNGDPQPHFVQVMATPKSSTAPVILTRAWIRNPINHGGRGPIILYVEVKKGELPVSAALVEATVSRPDVLCNGTGNRCRETFRLFDTGSGDPDVMKGDGIYTRYFNVGGSGKGAYKFDIVVTDNGNTAYSLSDNFILDAPTNDNDGAAQCCGSFVPVPSKQPLPSFQRVLPAITIFVTHDQVEGNRPAAVSDLGHIGDLKAELLDGMKVRLSWTSPDMGGLRVARYEVKYALSATDVIDNFETAAIRWEHDQPFAFSIGDDTSMKMNISAEPSLIGKRIFVAIRAYSELIQEAKPGPVSNVVSIYIARPPPPSTARPIHSTDNFFAFPMDDGTDGEDDLVGEASSRASLYDLSWEILIPIIAGICLVGILVCGFCYFCIVKRQKKVDFPKKKFNSKNDKIKVDNVINSPIHSMPHHRASPDHQSSPISSQQHQLQLQQQPLQQPALNYPSELDIPDHHTVGLPIYSSEEEIHKKRYSIVNDQEHQLIQKMKHQHIQRIFRPCALSVISSNNNTLTQNGRMFGGPYESWTPSQLLQEHDEQDHHNSPYDELVNQGMSVADQMHLINQHQQQQQHQADQYSLMNGNAHHGGGQLIDHMSINGAPPVPPLPYAGIQDSYPGGNIYSTGSTNGAHHNILDQPPAYIPTISQQQQQRIGVPISQANQFNTSLQGSMNSVHSGDKKKTRNVTMV